MSEPTRPGPTRVAFLPLAGTPSPSASAGAGGAAVAPFRPSPVGSVVDGAAAGAVEQGRAAGWAAGWAAGARAAADAARADREAFAEQHAAAEAAREARVAAALAVLRRAADAATARLVPVLDDAVATLDQGAVVLAQAVLGAELADGPTRARAALARALGVPGEAEALTVRLHPADLDVLRTLDVPLPDGVRLVPDGSLLPGDAVSELPDGYLDARIATAVERASRALGRSTEDLA